MELVPRRVRKLMVDENTSLENPIRQMEELRDQAAWVLLGEPGAGKSEAFGMEARATGGLRISIAKFLSDDPDPAWAGTTLFLDGLDETRASGGDRSTLLKVRAHLRKLGNPKFRIACRAADWFGSTDSQAISDASPDGQLATFALEPLSEAEIKEILRKNHDVPDPDDFVEQASSRGIDGLLNNPQTLRLLAEAFRGGQQPNTRQETFELACRKLADEDNDEICVQLRMQAISVERVLAAAGQLCAVLLLSDKSGLALSAKNADQYFPRIDDFGPDDLALARLAAGRKLFRPSTDGEERVVPSHRSIAEYLAAKWLAEQIDQRGLPLGRVLNLFLGRDERTIAGLRGLYGWLALHCQAARHRLIEADPLTVIVYGDVKPMSLEDKRKLLSGLRQEARQHVAFRWEIPSATPFGALADPGLGDEFSVALSTSERDDASQAYADCVLDILGEGEPIPELAMTIKAVVVDGSWWPRVRREALENWLKLMPPPEEAIALLDAINDHRLDDADDELTGQLLRHLYPANIGAERLLRYLHAPKERNLIGGFSMFFGYELPQIAPASHLPILLDQLAERTDLAFSDEVEFSFDCRRMLGALVSRGIEIHGDVISDECLYRWLGIGADKYGETRREKEHLQAIAQWLKDRPERYKAVLARCYKHCEGSEHVRSCIYTQEHRLQGATLPDDLGLWHLEQASSVTNDELAYIHAGEALYALKSQRACAGLSLKNINVWAKNNPERKSWLHSMLHPETPEWQREDEARTQARKLKHAEQKRQRSINLSKHLPAIRDGSAASGILHELAGVWMNHYTDTQGKTPLERFDSYCENGPEVLDAAESGFFHCPERADLPSVAEIIDLSTKGREHYIRKPCLIGMELRWQKGGPFVDELGDDSLRRMFAFRLTYGADNTPEWFTHFVEGRPALLAEVLTEYAVTTLKARRDFISGIYPLANDPIYSSVARLAVPAILAAFPVRARSPQLSQLDYLLKAALRYSTDQLARLIENKLAAKGMDVAQRVYWLTTAMLLDPPRYESELWKYIGKSWTRANHLCAFISDRFTRLSSDYVLSAGTLGKLIELLSPHAEFERMSGIVTATMQRGENIRAMVTRLGASASGDAEREIERLLALPALRKLKFTLESARHQLKLKQRETAFRFPLMASVTQILANRAPANSADLAAMALDYLDEIAYEIRNDNNDGVGDFWNIENKKNTGKRDENRCRNVLLSRLREHFSFVGIQCEPEKDYANDKRADICLSYRNEFELPIEIKRDDNRSLWTALRSQLMAQYTILPKASGFGIYLVLWFGQGDLPPAKDGGKKPVSAQELQARLEAQLDPEERRRVFVRVLDVSWPK